MTTSISAVSALQELADARSALARTAQALDSDGNTERKINKVIAVSSDTYTSYIRRVMEEIDREFQESYEKFRTHVETMLAQFHRMTGRILHRGQGRSSGTGKQSAKKSASSSGSSGGDSGGDGDGPARIPSKAKKHRSRKRYNTHSQHPPSFTPGAISSTPSQSPPPSPRQGLASLLLILCVFVIVLIAIGERDMAQYVLGSMAIPGLFGRLKNPPRDKR